MSHARLLPDHPISAIVWKLLFGGLLVNALAIAGLFLVGALSVSFRISATRSFIVAFIPVLLDALVIYGTVRLVGWLFFGRSGPLDHKRWERYLLGEIPGFVFGMIALFIIATLRAASSLTASVNGLFSGPTGWLFAAGGTAAGFGLGMFSVLTHRTTDAAQAAREQTAATQPQDGIPKQAAAPEMPEIAPAPPVVVPAPQAAAQAAPRAPVRLRGWRILLLAVMAAAVAIVLYLVFAAKDSSAARLPALLPLPGGAENSAAPGRPPAGCRLWSDISAADAGDRLCAYGVVKKAYLGGGNTYIVFSDDTSAFRLVNTAGEDYSSTVGQCASAEGEVKTYGPIAYIEVDGPLEGCSAP